VERCGKWRIDVYYILTTLHTILGAYPFGMQLALLGILAAGWILGRTSAEYAEALRRPGASGMVLAGLCAHLAVLLGLAIIADSMWLQSYTKARLVAALLLAIVVSVAICQRLALRAAHQVLLADGYESPYPAILPKQRGS
jgi:hypothetical protein